LFRVVGDKIGLGEEGVMRGLVLFYREDFEGIRDFIGKGLI